MKTETKHTPGPWKIDIETFNGKPEAFHVGHKGFRVASVDSGDLNAEANARLIVAAPELLWLAKQVQCFMLYSQFLTESTDAKNYAAKLAVAIARAEGGAS